MRDCRASGRSGCQRRDLLLAADPHRKVGIAAAEPGKRGVVEKPLAIGAHKAVALAARRDCRRPHLSGENAVGSRILFS